MVGLWDGLVYGSIAVAVLVVVARRLFGRAAHVAQIPVVKRQPIGKRDFTLAQLKEYDGSDDTKALLIGVKGLVYDVSSRSSFYGPGGGYALFTGHDASRALAKSSLDDADVSNPRIDDLTSDEMATLDEWADSYRSKYPLVGRLFSGDESKQVGVRVALSFGEHSGDVGKVLVDGFVANRTSFESEKAASAIPKLRPARPSSARTNAAPIPHSSFHR